MPKPIKFEKIKEYISSLNRVYQERSTIDAYSSERAIQQNQNLANSCSTLTGKIDSYIEKFDGEKLTQENLDALADIYSDIQSIFEMDETINSKNPTALKLRGNTFKVAEQNLRQANQGSQAMYYKNNAETFDLYAQLWEDPEMAELTEIATNPPKAEAAYSEPKVQEQLTVLKDSLTNLIGQYREHIDAETKLGETEVKINLMEGMVQKYEQLNEKINSTIDYFGENQLTSENYTELKEVLDDYALFAEKDEFAGYGKIDDVKSWIKDADDEINTLSQKQADEDTEYEIKKWVSEKAILRIHENLHDSGLISNLQNLVNEKIQIKEERNDLLQQNDPDVDFIKNTANSFNAKKTAKEDYNIALDNMGDLGRWWKGVQTELTASGYDIDLTSPEDLSRLMIVDCNKINEEITSEFTCNCRLAMDPDKEVLNFENNPLSKDQIKEKLSNTIPSREMLQDLFDAAKHGKLFVSDYPKQGQKKPRQIIATANYATRIADDIDHGIDRELEAVALPSKPKKPDGPGFFNSILAFFGNKKAKAAITSYNNKLNTYNENMVKWNTQKEIQKNDPEFYEITQNKFMANQGFFYSMDLNAPTYSDKISELHNDKVQAEEHDIAELNTMKEKQMSSYVRKLQALNLDNKLMYNNHLSKEALTAFAGMGYMMNDMINFQKDINDKNVYGHDLAIGKDLQNKVNSYAKSQNFKDICANISKADIKKIINSGKVSDVKNVMGKAIQKNAEQKNKAQQNVVKQPEIENKELANSKNEINIPLV